MPIGIRTEVKPGDKYGRLTVIKEVEKHIRPSGQKVRMVLCSCECDGKEVKISLDRLIKGKTPSCGCVQEERKAKLTPGDKYGRLTIIKEIDPYISPKGKKSRRVLCSCSCGNKQVEVKFGDLRRGHTTSCGCINKERMSKTHKKFNKYNIDEKNGVVTGYTLDGKEFYFDLIDYEKVKYHCWRIDFEGYVVTTVYETNKSLRMHRFIMDCPEDKVVDHIDHCKNNNRRENLRVCTVGENAMNKGIGTNNKSGVTGVYYDNSSKRWRACIMLNKKQNHLGSYINKEDAIRARLEAEKKYFGEFSNNHKQ